MKLANTYGLILCGGNSSRMGEDKAFISYHDSPQYHYLVDLLGSYCEKVFISCNARQWGHWPPHVMAIKDMNEYGDAGPMTGLLSAFNTIGNVSLLVAGCDYPFLNHQEIELIIPEEEHEFDAVCFRNPVTGLDEPLIAWYNCKVFPHLEEAYRNGQTSLRKCLSELHTKRVFPKDLKSITSIDYPDQLHLVHAMLGKHP